MSRSSPSKDDPLTVTVRIMGNEYSVACPEDEHEALVASAEFLNQRMIAIRRRGKALGTERIAVMAALNIARDLLAMKGEPTVSPVDQAAIEHLRQLGGDIESALETQEQAIPQTPPGNPDPAS